MKIQFLILLLGIIILNPVIAINIDSCSNLDKEGETYYLTKDIVNYTGKVCMNITANDIILDCQGHTIGGNLVGILAGNRECVFSCKNINNVTIKNCILSGFDDPIHLTNVKNSKIFNLTLRNNKGGIILEKANGNNLTNINSINSSYIGFYFFFSHNNTISNCTSNLNYNWGFYLAYSNDNIITNSTASNNERGFFIHQSSSNNISNCIAKNNSEYDLYIDANYDTECDNKIENLTGSNNLPIKYFNSSVNLANETLSELILCNADNSNIKNVTVTASQTKKNNGILLVRVDNSTLTDINSSDSDSGFYIVNSNSNTITNCTANLNSWAGFYLYSSNNNIITNSLASNNNWCGLAVHYSNSNTIKNCKVQENSNGITLYSSSNNTIYNNFFNNTNNYYFSGIVYTNYFNTTKQNGTRIYSNGTQIGGNYWAKPDGTGYSENCTDADCDGFCDDYCNLSDGNNTIDNIDYLPLSREYLAKKVESESTEEKKNILPEKTNLKSKKQERNYTLLYLSVGVIVVIVGTALYLKKESLKKK